jgi:hypothetical protein
LGFYHHKREHIGPNVSSLLRLVVGEESKDSDIVEARFGKFLDNFLHRASPKGLSHQNYPSSHLS